MDGIHDLGGKQGFGEVALDAENISLPEHWQGFVFALVNTLMRVGVAANIDHFRHAVERIDPAAYLSDGYYGRWLGAAETLLIEGGVVDQTDIDRRVNELSGEQPPACAARPRPLPDKFPAQDSESELAPTAEREVDRAARFNVGDRVTTVRNGSSGHTRLPGYARGSVGEVVTVHNAWVFPDTHAHTGNEAPQYLYTVRFEGEALYGKDCESGLFVNLDLFEPYLQEMNDVT